MGCLNLQFCSGLITRLLLTFLIYHSPVAQGQIEQFNVLQCAQLEAALKLNREQQRRGYKLKQELKIKAQQTQLELQIDYHCQHPQAVENRKPATAKLAHQKSAIGPSRSNRTKVNRSMKRSPTPALTMSFIAVKAPYQGAKQAAWLSFYQAPFYCFGVRQTERIRQCVEQRQQAQLHFEQQYDNGIQAVRP